KRNCCGRSNREATAAETRSPKLVLFQQEDRADNLERRIGFNQPNPQLSEAHLRALLGGKKGRRGHAQLARRLCLRLPRRFAELLGQRSKFLFFYRTILHHTQRYAKDS